MAKRLRRAAREAMATGGALAFAPMVVAMRLPLLAAEAASKPGQLGTEMGKAIGEKVAAAAQGIAAAQLSLADSAARFWMEALAGGTPSLLDGRAAERALHAALRPAGKAVRANYRRLSRRKP